MQTVDCCYEFALLSLSFCIKVKKNYMMDCQSDTQMLRLPQTIRITVLIAIINVPKATKF